MKRFIAIVLLTMLLLPFAACGKKQPDAPQDANAPQNAGTAEPAGTETAMPAGAADTSYNPETDADNRFTTANCTLIETDDGFYLADCECPYLLFYDYALEEMIPVCSRPECEHVIDNNYAIDNRSCDAWLSASRNPSLYNGKLYYVYDYGEQNPNTGGATLGYKLFRMNPDGTGKEFVKNLFPPGYGAPQWFILHRGNIYGFSHESRVQDADVIFTSSVVVLPLEGDETTFKTICEVNGSSAGGMRFIGDYCYFLLTYWEGDYSVNWDTGEEFDERVFGGKIGRWDSKTDELEILYDNLLPEGEYYLNLWAEPDGSIYVIGSQGLMKLEDGELKVIQSFDDSEKKYHAAYISDGVVIAHTAPSDFNDPYGSMDVWICRFDGSTVFKGELPMEWYYNCPEFKGIDGNPDFPGWRMAVGDETGIWVMFDVTWWRVPSENLPSAEFLVRFDFTDGGVQTKLYGTFFNMLVLQD